MNLSIRSGVVAVAGIAGIVCGLLSAGCGGGGGSAGPQEKTIQLGNMVTRVVGTAQPPVAANAAGSVVTGIAGANITSLTLNVGTPLIEDTRIAYYAVGSQSPGLYIVPPSGLDPVRVWQGGYGLSEPTWSADGTRLMFDGSVRGLLPPLEIRDGTSNTVMVDSTSATNNKSNISVQMADGSVRFVTSSLKDTNPAWWPNTRVTFESFRDGNSEIYVMNADGTGQTNLTRNAFADTNPCWSPDGNWIAYVSNRNGRNEIFQMSADGTSNTLLIGETTGGAWDPQYSPDGTKICFVSSRDGNSEIYTADANGLNPLRLTNNTVGDFDPSWSPDGKSIVWTRLVPGTNPEVWTMLANGGNQRRLIASAARPYWSPFVRSRAFVGEGAPMGTTASGFLFGQDGSATTSVVTFTAVTPADARINLLTPSGTNTTNFLFDVTAADAIRTLQYSNDFYLRPTVVVADSAAPTITGALVSFNTFNGKVASVLPYTANRSAAESVKADGDGTYRRRFVGIWDASGRNLAPGGASEVKLDPANGKVVSFR